jgi:hypothetical protein
MKSNREANRVSGVAAISAIPWQSERHGNIKKKREQMERDE